MAESRYKKYGVPLPPIPDENAITTVPQRSVSRENITSSTHFIPRRPQSRTTGGGKSAPRPHSIGSTIISNPKIVKGWQYYDNDPNQKDIQKYFSTINLPPASDTSEDDGDFEEVINLNKSTGEIKARVEEKDKKPCERFLGIVLTLVASAALALGGVVVKKLSECGYRPYSLAVWTFQGIFLPSLVVLWFACIAKRKNVIRLVQNDYSGSKGASRWKTVAFILFRAIFGLLGVVFKCYSLLYMSPADSVIITFSSAVFVAIAAWICLKEKPGIVTLVIALVVLLGCGIITKPPLLTGEKHFDRDQLVGSVMAGACMILGVFSVIILRYIRHVHYALITFIYGLVGTGGGLLLCWFDGEFQFPKTMDHWWLAGSVAGLTFIGQNLMTLALKYETASVFAVTRTSEIPFTFVWQLIFLSASPDLLSLIGGLLVILGVFVITGRKWVETLPSTHKARKWLGFLLI